MKLDALLAAACRLLAAADRNWPAADTGTETLTADGSSRRFLRLRHQMDSVLAVLPPPGEERNNAEARAMAAIGRHLRSQGCAVPRILGYDAESGLVLMEDLGDTRLHDLVVDNGWTPAVIDLYQQAVLRLAHLQVKGGAGFDPGWCWDTPYYDRALMLARESGYFSAAFCADLLGLRVSQAVHAEFEDLAGRAAGLPTGYFLHRDMQSRNIMLADGEIRFIDFQGGRIGPLAYDLASLLIDPYAAMPSEVQAHLADIYLKAVAELCPCDPEAFRSGYLLLALQRNLQILGAFAHLSKRKNKPFFRRFIAPALNSLLALLVKPECAEYAALRQLVHQCRAAIDRNSENP